MSNRSDASRNVPRVGLGVEESGTRELRENEGQRNLQKNLGLRRGDLIYGTKDRLSEIGQYANRLYV